MIIVGIVGVNAIVISAVILGDSVSALGEMYDTGGERIKTLQELDKGIAHFRTLCLKHMNSENAQDMDTLNTELKQIKRNIETMLPSLYSNKVHLRQNTLQEVSHLKQAINAYFTEITEAILLSADFEKEQAFKLLTDAEVQHLSVLQNTIQSLTRHAFEDISASRDNLMAAANRNLHITIIIGILGGIVLLSMAFYVTRRTSQRLADLLAWSERIALGDLSTLQTHDSTDEVGQLTHAMHGMVENISRGRLALEAAKKGAESVAKELQLYANAFESSGDAMLISDKNNLIVDINASFTRQTGYGLHEVRGKDPGMLSSGKTPKAVYQDMWNSLQTSGYWQGELWDRKKCGEVYPKWASISVIRNNQQEAIFYIASFSDISERKANEARIDYLAHHDALTGLINRYNLENRLGQALLSAHRNQLPMAVMFIDMDRFKTINDTLGHHVGDQLLIEVSHRLRDSVRESDIVARLGGDEFVVALTNINSELDAAPVSEKILRVLGQPYTIAGKVLHSSPSIGIAIFPTDGGDGATLMKNADTAMYHAKERGRNNVQFFTSAMNAAAHERLTLENDLRYALKEGQLSLHYQPQVCAIDGKSCGVEALARWFHPVLGYIPPLKFIPIAEESGLIETLGRWVLGEACRQMSAWQAEGILGIRIAVNLSAQQLRAPGLVQSVAEILAHHHLKGSDLELEITESIAMENPERAIGQLQALRDMGVQLAIDDFGTGYSSLSYLKRLPIQVLKLDRSFVHDIDTNVNDAEISAATLALAHTLGLKVVAEGVETVAQRNFLTRHHCDFLQGYLFSKPLPADEAKQYLLNNR